MVKGFKIFTVGCFFIAAIPQMSARDATLGSSESLSLVSNYCDDGTMSLTISKPRDVHFTNDLADVVDLALTTQKEDGSPLDEEEKACINHFRNRPVVIRAVKEYTTHHGDKVKVETHNSWELTFQELQNKQLLSLRTFSDLVEEYVMMPKKQFKNIFLNWITSTYNKLKFVAIRLAMKKAGKTTFVVDTNIDQTYESIHCSDIILDLDELASQNENNIEKSVDYSNPLHLRIYIKQVA